MAVLPWILAMPSCGAYFGRALTPADRCTRPFTGVRCDYDDLMKDSSSLNVAIGILDTPLSLLVDVVLLPAELYCKSKSSELPSKARKE